MRLSIARRFPAARIAVGRGAGLVQDHGVHAADGLQHARVAHQDAAPPGGGDRCGQRQRGRDAERAGAGDHQHRDGVHQRVRRISGAHCQPAKVIAASASTAGMNSARHAVHRALHFVRLAAACSTRAHDARQRALGADARGANFEHASGVDAAAHHGVAGSFGHRRRFAGEHALVHVRAALGDDAVGGQALARFHAEDRARLQRLDARRSARGRPAPGAPCWASGGAIE